MEKKVKIVESFFAMSGIQLNPNKSELIVIENKYNRNTPKEIKMKEIPIRAIKKDQTARYLGIWINGDSQKMYQKTLIMKKVNDTSKKLKAKKITDKIYRYIINTVLCRR